MDTIRAKQAMEIIDVFKNVRSQVSNLDKRSVNVSTQSRLPKVQRDISAEVNVDKSIELMNKTLESKLGALEFVVQNLEQGSSLRELSRAENRQILTQSFQNTNNTGDLIPLWNGIVRQFKQRGVSVETQEIIRQKVLELEPNLEAMIYGINETIEYIFQQPFIGVRKRGPGAPKGPRARPGGEPPAPPPPTEPAEEKTVADRPYTIQELAQLYVAEKKNSANQKGIRKQMVDAGFGKADINREIARARQEKKREILVEDEFVLGPEDLDLPAPAPPRGQRDVLAEDEFVLGPEDLNLEGQGRMVGGADGDPEFLHQNALVILDYLRTLSFYKTLKLQVDSGKLELFDQQLLSSAFNNIFDTLSSERINLLKRVVPRGVLGKSSIRNIPANLSDTDARLDALGEELSIKFPQADYDKLRKMPRGAVDRELAQYREQMLSFKNAKHKLNANITSALEKELEKILNVRQQFARAESTYREIQDEIQGLEYEGREALSWGEFQDLEEVPPQPDYPESSQFEDFDEYIQALLYYEQYHIDMYPILLENLSKEEHNQLVQRTRNMTYTQKRQEMDALQNELEELDVSMQRLAVEEQQLDETFAIEQDKADEKGNALDEEGRKKIQVIIDRLDALKAQPISDIRPAVGEGKGRAIDTRGMASIRKNYGFASSSDSDSDSDSDSSDGGDVMDYDDRRNDMYTSRPYRK